MTNEEEISCKDFLTAKNNYLPINLIDVREKIEFATFNIGGVHIPISQLAQLIEFDELPFKKDEEIFVICQHGIRSKTAQIMLKNEGFTHVRNVKGGLISVMKESL